jgi:type VI protein secretion system component VasF
VSGPLAQLLADAAELRAKVQRVEELAEKLDTDITKCRTYAAQAQVEFDLASEASYAMQAANLDAVSTRLHAALNGEKS